MKLISNLWLEGRGWKTPLGELPNASLVIMFCDYLAIKQGTILNEVMKAYPKADVVGTSASQIVYEDQVITTPACSITVISLEKSKHEAKKIFVSEISESFKKGKELADSFPKDGLKHIILFTDGTKIDGTAFVDGMQGSLPEGIVMTGGAATGREEDLTKTFAFWNKDPQPGTAVGIALYGNSLSLFCNANTGYKDFGRPLQVTKSENNVIQEINRKSALATYKKYLGANASKLPDIGLIYPINIIKSKEGIETNIARTVFGVDEDAGTIITAGGIPEGSTIRFMMTTTESLVNGAKAAIEPIAEKVAGNSQKLVLLMSCYSRFCVMRERVSEEIAAVRKEFGDSVTTSGFYTWGEISPVTAGKKTEFLNQTMCVTIISEE